jgi:hypothetical protein
VWQTRFVNFDKAGKNDRGRLSRDVNPDFDWMDLSGFDEFGGAVEFNATRFAESGIARVCEIGLSREISVNNG